MQILACSGLWTFDADVIGCTETITTVAYQEQPEQGINMAPEDIAIAVGAGFVFCLPVIAATFGGKMLLKSIQGK